jgi:hypothetical protein
VARQAGWLADWLAGWLASGPLFFKLAIGTPLVTDEDCDILTGGGDLSYPLHNM